MKRSEPQVLREILEETIRECDMEQELLRYRACSLWGQLMGQHIADSSGKPFFRGSVMYVSIHNASLRHELMMMRSSIAEALNNALKQRVVTEIRFIGANPNK